MRDVQLSWPAGKSLRLPSRVVASALVLALAISAVRAFAAAEGTPKDREAQAVNWQLERVYVPADRAEEWPREPGQRYVPMEAKEFEDRLSRLQKRADPSIPPAASLISGDYSATYKDENLIEGRAVWTFDFRGQQATTAVLGDSNLPIADAQWLNSSKAPLIGNDELGRLNAVVDRAGSLLCKWSMQGRHDGPHAVVFDLRLPSAPLNKLHIKLPADRVPLVDQGVAETLGPVEAGMQNWLINLGGFSKVTLRIVDQNAAIEQHNRPLIDSSLDYDFSGIGLELTARFHLCSLGALPRQLKLNVDGPLSVVSVRLGSEPLVFSASQSNSASTEIELQLPEMAPKTQADLQVTAVAPISWNSRWVLPGLRIANCHWEKGDANLRIAPVLCLADLDCGDSRRTGTGPERQECADERENGKVALQCFSDQPKIAVILSPRAEQIEFASGSEFTLRANECSARSTFDFTALAGEQFTLEGEVSPSWIIDDVECASPERLTNWSYQVQAGQWGRLILELASPVKAGRDLKITIHARSRRAPQGERLGIRDFELLRFIGVKPRRQLISLHAIDPYQLQLSGAEALHAFSPSQLSPADSELLIPDQAQLIFEDDEAARPLGVSLALRPPRYQAEIDEQVIVEDDTFTESYRFAITPQGREMSRVLVRFSQPRTEAPKWSFTGRGALELKARQFSDAEQAPIGPEGDVWEVLLPEPQSGPFEVCAQRQSALNGDTPIALAALVGAESQSGTVTISSTGRFLPQLTSRRLTALPVSPASALQQSKVVAAFHYEPAEDTLLVAEPPLVIAANQKQSAEHSAWVWRAVLNSRFDHGSTENDLLCEIENEGQKQIEFGLPLDAELRETRVNENAISDAELSPGGTVALPLPTGMRFITVRMSWTERPSKASSYQNRFVQAPWPDCNLPMISKKWVVDLPPGTTISTAQIAGENVVAASWIARVFGPAAENFGHQPGQLSSGITEAEIDTGLKSPWTIPGEKPAGIAGWTRYVFDDGGKLPGRLWLANRQTELVCFWATLLFASGLSWFAGSRPREWSVAVLAFALAVALIAPPAWIPITSAVWLGLASGRVLILIRPSSTVAQISNERSRLAFKLEKMAPTTFVVLAVLVASASSAAPTDGVKLAEVNSNVRQVLIPIDDMQKPTGGNYFLTPAFYDEFVRATDDGPPTSDYLIRTAKYFAEAGSRSASAEASAGDWLAEYEIDSAVDNAEFKFPFDRQSIALFPDGAAVDGKSKPFSWDSKSRQITVGLGPSGRHRLELKFRPCLQNGQVDFAIPRAATARIVMNPPARQLWEAPWRRKSPRKTSQQTEKSRFL